MTEPPQKVRVFVVDDQPMVLKGLRALLSLQPDLEVCGDALDAIGAWKGIAAAKPHVVVLDLSLGQYDGIHLLQCLRQDFPAVKVLVFSMHGDGMHLNRAFQAGACGFVTKPEGTEKLIEAIRLLMERKPHPSQAPRARKARATQEMDSL
jgi:two-component system, NarL family, invasion response regulator UvrY